jgi:hypothetical protein
MPLLNFRFTMSKPRGENLRMHLICPLRDVLGLDDRRDSGRNSNIAVRSSSPRAKRTARSFDDENDLPR